MALPRTSRGKWIEEGLSALAAGGPDAVRIEVLAQALGVTTGGFYGYFANRDELLTEMLDLWEREVADAVIEQVERDGGDGRARLARLFTIGLLRYISGTPVADRIAITYTPPKAAEGQPASKPHDPWDYWVFHTRANGFFQGESSSNSIDVSGGLSANRTTEAWKLSLSLNAAYSENHFDIDSVTTVKSTSKNYSANALGVRSIGGHWALGAIASASRSTYSNQARALRFAPGIEYDVFPYAETTRRQLTLRYNVGVNAFKYDEETIFLKTRETLFDESLTASLDSRQPWGSVSVSLEGAHYLDDFSKNRLQLFSNFDVRIFRGFSVSFFGSVSRVRDQRYLPAAGATPEEVLLQRRALATSYRYFGSVGLNYTFGSIFNNVVNPRFGGSSGGTMIMF